MQAWIAALIVALWAGGGTLFAAAAHAGPTPRIVDLVIDGGADRSRIVIESDQPIEATVFALDAGLNRIVVDFPKVRWSIKGLTAEAGSGAGGGLVSAYQYAHNSPTSSRLVLDLVEPAIAVKESTGRSGKRFEITIDLKAASPDDFRKSVAATSPKPHKATPTVFRKPLIVIDPGHGGKDPGALSAAGTLEKDVNLAAALALRDALERTGRYEVALTRSDDTFMELEARVEKARELGGTLFLSLHADAGPKPGIRGASIYTLSPEGEKRAESARLRNDWVLAVETDTSRSEQVNQILVDLVQRETKNQSARFAQILAPTLDEAGWPVLAHAHRRRGFFVLLSPDVPAVLLEMGFVTNAEDEAMLTSKARRARLVGAIVEAIDVFFGYKALLAQR